MKIITREEKLLWCAKTLARIIAENGGESFRAENTCEHVLLCGKAKSVDVLAVSTGIIISVSFDGISTRTVMCRIKKRELAADMINKANNYSRMFCSGSISLDELYMLLKKEQLYRSSQTINKETLELSIYGGLAAAFFTLLFDGVFLDFFTSFLCGLIITLLYYLLEKRFSKAFITSFVCGMAAVSISIFLSVFFTNIQTGLIVTGSIMPILPGIIITFAFRDSINGDFISGSAGLLEALLSAVSLAGGVGFVINIFLSLNIEIGRIYI